MAKRRSDAVVFIRLHIGHFVKYREKALATASRRPLFEALPGSQLFGERRRDHIVNGQVLRLGDLPRLLVKLFRNVYADTHSVCLINPRNSAGVRTVTRRFTASTKSLLLYVTIIPPHWIARSSTSSSSGSDRVGRIG